MDVISARLVCSLTVLTISACSLPPLQPERLMGIQSAFPQGAELAPPADNTDAVRTSIFEAPYEDVFRAASVAASQAQFNVETIRKPGGLILASRVVKMVPRGTDDFGLTDHAFFYAISVRELAPKRSEVRISAKVQGKCSMTPIGLVTVMSAGMVTGAAMDKNAYCERLSAGMWAAGNHSASQELSQFLTFLRNNLIAAGLI